MATPVSEELRMQIEEVEQRLRAPGGCWLWRFQGQRGEVTLLESRVWNHVGKLTPW